LGEVGQSMILTSKARESVRCFSIALRIKEAAILLVALLLIRTIIVIAPQNCPFFGHFFFFCPT